MRSWEENLRVIRLSIFKVYLLIYQRPGLNFLGQLDDIPIVMAF